MKFLLFLTSSKRPIQEWIQDFPGGANQMEGLQPIIPPIFPENCMEMQTIGPKRGGTRVQNFTM